MWDTLGWSTTGRLTTNFIEYESFLTNLDYSTDSSNFSITHMYVLCSMYVSFIEGRNSFCTGLVSRKTANYYLCFQLPLLLSVFYFFLIYRSSSSSFCKVFGSVSSNINEILSINQSANVSVFGDSNVNQKDWLNYSDGTDRPGELYYNFPISNDLT